MKNTETDATVERDKYIKQTEAARKRAQEPDQRPAPATKAEEWAALRKIAAIVDSLGTDSYIGTAFTGVWAIAELNIENDWADSVRGEQELLEERIDILARQVSEAKQEANELREELRGAEERGREQMDLAEENAAARERAEEALAEAENRAEALKRSRYEYNQKLTAANARIAELEARLKSEQETGEAALAEALKFRDRLEEAAVYQDDAEAEIRKLEYQLAQANHEKDQAETRITETKNAGKLHREGLGRALAKANEEKRRAEYIAEAYAEARDQAWHKYLEEQTMRILTAAENQKLKAQLAETTAQQ